MFKFIGKLFHNVILSVIVVILLITVLPACCGYLSHLTTFGGAYEQLWLDHVIRHLRILRHDCRDDQELFDVLDYTIQRYHRIGPFDVAVTRCDWYPFKDKDTVILGYNNPLIYGITIDIQTISELTTHAGAMIVVHEALHDYFPYGGHSHVYPVLDRMEKVYYEKHRF